MPATLLPTMDSGPALARLARLAPGRHYGASADSGCWVMVGRDLRDVTEWSIVPPAASLTLSWGEGGCEVEFGGGRLRMRRGDWMWIDAGCVHRGENHPGSDFLTVFIPEALVRAAALDCAPIGAAAQPAPVDLAAMLTHLAVEMLDGTATRRIEAPPLDAILDWVGTHFAPQEPPGPQGEAAARAAAMLRQQPGDAWPIAAIAQALGVSRSEFSRRFKRHYRVTPQTYRLQVQLARATRELAAGSSVLAAAHQAGFADTAHLSRTFRAQYGIAPSQWSRHFKALAPALHGAARSGAHPFKPGMIEEGSTPGHAEDAGGPHPPARRKRIGI